MPSNLFGITKKILTETHHYFAPALLVTLARQDNFETVRQGGQPFLRSVLGLLSDADIRHVIRTFNSTQNEFEAEFPVSKSNGGKSSLSVAYNEAEDDPDKIQDMIVEAIRPLVFDLGLKGSFKSAGDPQSFMGKMLSYWRSFKGGDVSGATSLTPPHP